MNQRVSGGQWVLLGTYPFNASGSGYKVDLADTSASGKVVADAIYYVQDGAPVGSFTWAPDIQSAGDYQLYARWTASSANSGAAQYTVVHGGGTSLVTVSQKQNGGQWNLLGTWNFAPSAGHQVTLTAASDGNVVADAIKLVGTGPAPANLVYLHSDQIGLPQKITDATQAVVWDRVQDPFGRQVSLTSSGGIDTALRFPGQQADPDTGFAYNYFRDYDPTLGRYVQADPIGLAGGINRYAYVGGNPTAWADPYGLDSIEISYDYYPVNTGLGFSLPLGHSAVVSVDPATGRTRYYEFGRYTDKACGNVRRQRVPDLKIGPDGLPTPESLSDLYSYISKNYGHSTHVTPTYYADSDYEATIDYAERFGSEHSCYSLLGNNCKTFAHAAATACKEGQTCQ